MFSSQRAGLRPYFRVGTSLWVITAFTPGSFSASEVSMETIRAWAWGEVRILPKSMLGNFRSPVYLAAPVTFSGPSMRGTLRPITLCLALISISP